MLSSVFFFSGMKGKGGTHVRKATEAPQLKLRINPPKAPASCDLNDGSVKKPSVNWREFQLHTEVDCSSTCRAALYKAQPFFSSLFFQQKVKANQPIKVRDRDTGDY